MQNAQDALIGVEKPQVLVRTTFDDVSIKLRVIDNGHGFPVDLIAQAFEPYVTTKAHGTGLGLAIVKKMIEEHHGQIKIENNQTGGACITIMLPIEKSIEKNNDFSIPAKKKSVRKAKVVSQQKIVKVA
jgi:nitrogen fixation/metabolism regulation signal transduction histidine kinase